MPKSLFYITLLMIALPIKASGQQVRPQVENYTFGLNGQFQDATIDLPDIGSPGETIILSKCDLTWNANVTFNNLFDLSSENTGGDATLQGTFRSTVEAPFPTEELFPCLLGSRSPAIADPLTIFVPPRVLFMGRDPVSYSMGGSFSAEFPLVLGAMAGNSYPVSFRTDIFFSELWPNQSERTYDGGAVTFQLTYNIYSPQAVDIILGSDNDMVQLAQIVFDPDFSPDLNIGGEIEDGTVDIVRGKAFDVVFKGMAVGLEVGRSINYEVFVELVGANVEFSVGEFLTQVKDSDGNFEDFVAIPPGLNPGVYRVRIEADHTDQFSESMEDNNVAFSKEFRVHDVNPMSIGVVRVNCGNCTSNLEEEDLEPLYAEELRAEYNKILPLPPEALTIENTGLIIEGNSDNVTNTDYNGTRITSGVLDDVRRLENYALANNLRKVFVAVDPSYFSFHGEGAVGGVAVVGRDSRRGRVAFGLPATGLLQHEVAHLLGAVDARKLAPKVNGFDNSLRQSPRVEKFDLMAPPAGALWPDQDAYSSMFFTLTKPEIDPELVIFSGIFDNLADEIIFSEIEEHPQGTISDSDENGRLEVRLENPSGDVVESKKVATEKVFYFEKVGLEPDGFEIDLVQAPFSVALENKSGATTVVALLDGEEVFRSPIVERNSNIIEIINELSVEDFTYRFDFISNIKLFILKKMARKIQKLVDTGRLRKAVKKIRVLTKLLKISQIDPDKKLDILEKIKKYREELNN